MKIKVLLILTVLGLFEIQSFAQSTYGTVKGSLVDFKLKEPISGASIVLAGTTPPIGTASDADGHFTIPRVAAGKHTLVISFISFKTKNIDITVYPDQTVTVNTTLEDDVAMLSEVKVVGQRKTFTDVSVITEVRQAEQVAVGISAQQIQKTQDRDASQVIRRIPGVSIQDDRFVIIRGLNERYNTVMLNDAITPSTEVDVKSFSFDLIPSSAIDRMVIFKSGAPELPGEFSGGVIKIYTKTIPDEDGFSVNISTGFRGNTTFQKAIDYKGSSMDWLGFGAGDRKLPTSFPKLSTLTAENRPSETTLNAFRNLPDFFNLQNKNVSPDLRASVGFNRSMYIGDKRLTTFNNISYSNANQLMPTEQYRYLSFNNATNSSEVDTYYKDQFYGQNTRLGVMSNWAFFFNPNHKIEFRNLFNQLSNKETTYREGYSNDNDRDVQNYAFRYESKSIYTGQLSGTHHLSDLTTVKWTGAFGLTNRDEPDFRRLVTSRNIGTNDPFRVEVVPGGNASLTRGARFYSSLNEYTSSFRGDIERKIKRGGEDGKMDIKLRAGGYVDYKDRMFAARWFNLSNPGGVSEEILGLGPEALFKASNIALDKLYYGERTNFDDKYNAQNLLLAGYVGASIPLSEKLSTALGVRVENNHQKLQSRLRGSGARVKVDNPVLRVLPSINLTYNLTEKSLVRAAYAITLNRPEFRELAPFNYYDFTFDVTRVGNPGLKTPSIQNADIRYEYYPAEGELISIAGFYKHFRNPIETRVNYSGSGVSFSVDNAAQASTYGAELELRKALKGLTNSGFVDRFTLLLNAAVIKSDVLTGFAGQEDNRQLQGQSPYLINSGLYYHDPLSGWQFNLLYNVIGKRIFMVGDKEVQPTVYEMPRNVIDLNIIKSIGSSMEIKLGIQDLLNQKFQLIQDSNLDRKITGLDEPYQTYRRGTYSTLGLTYKF